MDDIRRDHQHFLVIGMPTVPRKNEMDYLLRTLDALRDQVAALRAPLDLEAGRLRLLPAAAQAFLRGAHARAAGLSVLVVVMNVSGLPHGRFLEAQARYRDAPFIEFREHLDPQPLEGPQQSKNRNVPNAKVRKQTRDLVALLRAAQGRGRHFLFMEDDFVACPGALLATLHYLWKADARAPDWLAVRSSYGMNGIALQDKDLGAFADYMEQHQARRPCDHLVVEWFAGETRQAAQHKRDRPHFAYRYNLFDHVGVTSSLRAQASPIYPICYEMLHKGILFEVEAFDPKQCPGDDLWPCDRQGDYREVFQADVLYDKDRKEQQKREHARAKQNSLKKQSR